MKKVLISTDWEENSFLIFEIINHLKQFAHRFHIDVGCIDIIQQNDGKVQVLFEEGTFPIVPVDTFIDSHNALRDPFKTMRYDAKEEGENVMKWNLKVNLRIEKLKIKIN